MSALSGRLHFHARADGARPLGSMRPEALGESPDGGAGTEAGSSDAEAGSSDAEADPAAAEVPPEAAAWAGGAGGAGGARALLRCARGGALTSPPRGADAGARALTGADGRAGGRLARRALAEWRALAPSQQRALRGRIFRPPLVAAADAAKAPPPPRTNRTRRVPPPVLIGHAASLTPY